MVKLKKNIKYNNLFETKMLCNYLFIDDKYRIDHSKHIQRILIEQHHFIKENTIDLNEYIKYVDYDIINDKYKCKKQINIINRFYGISKELFIITQLNKEKQLNKYLVNNQNILTGMKIKYNGKLREEISNIDYLDLVQKHQYHSVNNSSGINVYSFSLYPDDLQPSGVSNFSKIGELELELEINWKLILSLNTSERIIRVAIYNTFYNFLNFIGGQAGLLYTNIDL